MNKNWKNVSVSECFGIILRSIIGFLLLFIPASVDPFTFSFNAISIIGDGSLTDNFVNVATTGLPNLVSFFSSYTDILTLVYKLVILLYFVFLILNIFNALLLILTKNNVLRIIFRVLSYVAGVWFLISAVLFLLYFVAIFGYSSVEAISLSMLLNTCSALYALGGFIFCVALGFKQFNWFKKPFTFVK